MLYSPDKSYSPDSRFVSKHKGWMLHNPLKVEVGEGWMAEDWYITNLDRSLRAMLTDYMGSKHKIEYVFSSGKTIKEIP